MRRVAQVTIKGDPSENRDHGKRFVIKEMPALPAEKWAYRVIIAIAAAGGDVAMIKGMGMAGLAIASLQALPNIKFEDAEPLMDEMLPYIRIVPNPEGQHTWEAGRALLLNTIDGEGDDIEEIDTFTELRRQFVELHTRFFSRGEKLSSTSGTTTDPNASSVQTSPPR